MLPPHPAQEAREPRLAEIAKTGDRIVLIEDARELQCAAPREPIEDQAVVRTTQPILFSHRPPRRESRVLAYASIVE